MDGQKTKGMRKKGELEDIMVESFSKLLNSMAIRSQEAL